MGDPKTSSITGYHVAVDIRTHRRYLNVTPSYVGRLLPLVAIKPNYLLFRLPKQPRLHKVDNAMTGRETVVVTGFGPFRQFLVNASWKAAQGLKLVGLGEQVDVCIKEVPVTYAMTQRLIAEIWETLHPKFAVHLGVARGSGVILEQTGGPEKLDSVVDMRAVLKEFQEAGVDVIYSRDAGRFLCDFAYYCSLYHGERRAALIHVPSSGCLSSADSLVPLLQTLIQAMLDQLEDPVTFTPDTERQTKVEKSRLSRSGGSSETKDRLRL